MPRWYSPDTETDPGVSGVYPENAVIQAPVAGHTDLPMRRASRRHGCRFAFTEMIDAGSLVFQSGKTPVLAVRGDDEDFLGIQLVGSDLPLLERAVEIVNGMRFDVLDFNLGCPAPKVAKKGEGITFVLKDPDGALRAAETIVRKSAIPVTVKTRILDFDDPAPTVAFCRRLAETGIAALTLHGRVAKAFYSGPAAFHVISAVREAVPVPVIANGGALTPESYRELLEKTGCSRGMIARGALGNPWLFDAVLHPDSARPPTVEEFAAELERHVREMTVFYGEELGFRIARKTVLEYLRGRGFAGSLRASVSYLDSFGAFGRILDEVRKGPSLRYWEFLEARPGEVERKLSR